MRNDVFSKYAWTVPLKDEKVIAITNALQKVLDEARQNQIKYGQIKEFNFKIDQ